MTLEQAKHQLVEVSVVICTRNRADSLGKTLDSISKMVLPANLSWEVLIVDNGSTDRTPEVVENFSKQLPVRTVVQNVPGLSNARNKGVESARGELIFWTDDDVVVDENWLVVYLKMFRSYSECSIMAGKAIPAFEEPKADWFVKAAPFIQDLLASRDFGSELINLSAEKDVLPFGLNFALRSAVQRKFQYDASLGVAPGRRSGGEEIDVALRILRSGYSGVWLPDAIVYHQIPLSRQTAAYISDYYYGAGISRGESDILSLKDYSEKQIMWCGAPLRLWIKYVLASALFVILKPVPGCHWVRMYTRKFFNKGRIFRWREMSIHNDGTR